MFLVPWTLRSNPTLADEAADKSAKGQAAKKAALDAGASAEAAAKAALDAEAAAKIAAGASQAAVTFPILATWIKWLCVFRRVGRILKSIGFRCLDQLIQRCVGIVIHFNYL